MLFSFGSSGCISAHVYFVRRYGNDVQKSAPGRRYGRKAGLGSAGAVVGAGLEFHPRHASVAGGLTGEGKVSVHVFMCISLFF